ncbi:MAG: bifunctional hydroxymethylpyrimidine kinase/phosphomethylpyrimidine kinase [Cohaesibacteraceae bacterium]|nr:bifunctional hydroxymethylpyrimidine kinase/phosphomethylpyrimidine kinase [Cohaesibacteraceae bacterium]
MTAIAVSIAGSDSCAGAGIQADLKTFSALGVYGVTIITAITAQNTRGVQAVHIVPAPMIKKQLQSIFLDFKVDAIKIGMLPDEGSILSVAGFLSDIGINNIVLDPVMISSSGHNLASHQALNSLKTRLLPLASLLTPNLSEAARLLDVEVAQNRLQIETQAKALKDLGPGSVLMKGGHSGEEGSADFLLTDTGGEWIEGVRHPTINTHGTGCTLSSAITAFLASGHSMEKAVRLAKSWTAQTIFHADEIKAGSGTGPVHQFFKEWNSGFETI